MALNVGDRLGHYDVTALIGQGGMGEVWRAHDTDPRQQAVSRSGQDFPTGKKRR